MSDAVEIIEKRTSHTRTFDLGGRKRRLVSSQEIINHPDKNGLLQPVDLEPAETDGTYVIKGAGYRATVDLATLAVSVVNDQGAEHLIETLDSPDTSNIEREGRGICVKDAFPGVDLILSFSPTKVEWYKRIKSSEARHEFTWKKSGSEAGFSFRESPIGQDADGNKTEIKLGQSKASDGGTIWTEQITGRVSKVIDLKTRRKSYVETAQYPLMIDVPDVSVSVSSAADNGYFITKTGYSTFNNYGMAFGGYAYGMSAWMRFQGITVPKGSTIDGASLKTNQLRDDQLVDTAKWRWKIKDVDNVASAPSSKAQVTASAATVTAAMDSPNSSNTTWVLKTHDLAPLIDHIVNRAGWASGNNIVIFAKRTDGPFPPFGYRGWQRIAEYGHPTEAPPLLEIDYTSSGIIFPADAGSFTFSGQSAGLKATRKLAAAAGSFALSGKSATLLKKSKLAAAAGSFALTGRTSGLNKGYTFPISAGAFSLTGQDAGFLFNRRVMASGEAFTLTGNAASLLRGAKAIAAVGTFDLSGKAAGLRAARLLSAAPGSFTLTGVAASLRAARTVVAASGSYDLSGEDAGLRATRLMSPDAGEFILTGNDATLGKGYGFMAASGSFLLTGGDVGLIRDARIVADVGSFQMAGISVGAVLTMTARASASGEYHVEHDLPTGDYMIRVRQRAGSATSRWTEPKPLTIN